MNEKRSLFFFFPGVKKQTRPVLSVEIRKRTSCGEKPSEGACSETEHAFHPGHHRQPLSLT